MKFIYKPIGIFLGILGGLLGKRLFNFAWTKIDDEDPPKATTEYSPWVKIIGAAALQGVIFKVTRVVVDRYGANDMRSMRADNTSAFNCRYRDGVCCTWSQHAYGRAIDINPVENPYVGSWGVSPPQGADFVDRTPIRRGMLARRDRPWWAFHAIGWSWGGSWSWPVDYQHFSATNR